MGRNALKYVRDSQMACCQVGSKNLHFNEFEKLSRRSQTFAQRNFCSNPENIFS